MSYLSGLKAIAFDADGTLWRYFEPSKRNHKLTVEAMRESGEARYEGLAFDDAQFLEAWRRSLPTDVFLVRGIPGLGEIPDGAKDFRSWYERVVKDRSYPVFEGVMQMMQGLKSGRFGKEYVLALLTAHSRENIRQRAERNGFDMSLFDMAFYDEDIFASGVSSKSDPKIFDCLAGGLKNYGISLQEAAYVADTIPELRAAMDRDILFVAVVGDGHTTKEEFVAEGLSEEFIIQTPAELTKFLR